MKEDEPQGADTRKLPPIPSGIERLLRQAANNEAFRQELVRRRSAAATEAGIELSPSEAAILTAIPGKQLLGMVDSVSPQPAPRRAFLQQSAATAAVLLGGSGLATSTSCRRERRYEAPGGASPDMPSRKPRPRSLDYDFIASLGPWATEISAKDQQAQATQPALAALASRVAPTMVADSHVIVGRFQTGQIVLQAYELRPQVDYVVVAIGAPGVQELDIMVVRTGVGSISDHDHTDGPEAVLGRPNQYLRASSKWDPLCAIVLKVSAGQGMASAQVFSKPSS